MADFLVIDLEMCKVPPKMQKKIAVLKQEIIQIGAVILNEENEICDGFSTFVRPVYGVMTPDIQELTGISETDFGDAPLLGEALSRMIRWLDGREVMVLSWSVSDYEQVRQEMNLKKIRNRGTSALLDNWADLQKTFGDLVGIHYQMSLEKALEAASLTVVGHAHDGLDDARNTARLLMKIRRSDTFVPEFTRITETEEPVEHLNFTMGSLFSAELLNLFDAQPSVEEPESEPEEAETDPYQRARKVLFGMDREDNWILYDFRQVMAKITLDEADPDHQKRGE